MMSESVRPAAHRRVVILQEGESHHHVREGLAAAGIRQLPHIGHKTGNVQELRNRGKLLRLFIDHQRRADAQSDGSRN